MKVSAIWRTKDKRYVLRWRDQGRTRQQATDLTDRRGDRNAARMLAAEKQRQLERLAMAGGMFANIDPDDVTRWEVFSAIFEREHMRHLSTKSMQNWKASKAAVEEHLKPATLADLTSPALLVLMTRLSGRPATIRTRMAWIRRALTWAASLELIDRVPTIPSPRNSTEPRQHRSVTREELDRMIDVLPRVAPTHVAPMSRLMLGLWHSGFRIGELLALSWDVGAGIVLEKAGDYPTVTFRGDSQKNRKTQTVPVTPDFWRLCREVRTGLVFPVQTKRKTQMSQSAAVRIVSKCGEVARVVVDPTTQETATSTDIGRRAFATRMSRVLTPAQLAQTMRHSTSETTNRHYVRETLQETAAKLWTSSTAQEPPTG